VHWNAVAMLRADSEFAVKSYSIISDIAYIALTPGRQLPSLSGRPETPFL
jgi:hypothetical protein